jgi:hypothetical protein
MQAALLAAMQAAQSNPVGVQNTTGKALTRSVDRQPGWIACKITCKTLAQCA